MVQLLSNESRSLSVSIQDLNEVIVGLSSQRTSIGLVLHVVQSLIKS